MTGTLQPTWKTTLLRAVAAFALACIVSAVTIICVTGGIETGAAGFLAALTLIPSIILYVVLDHFAPARPWKHNGYLLPVCALVVFLLVGIIADLGGYLGEGAGIPAVALITLAVPASLTYVFLATKTPPWNGRD
jgi:hypothetical protein